MKKTRLYLLLFPFLYFACGGASNTEEATEGSTEETATETEESADMIHQEVITEDTVNMSADDLFAAIASFDKVENVLPGVIVSTTLEGEGVGATRSLALADDGGDINEEMIELDQENMVMSYKIISSPLPPENYVATLKVVALDENKCILTWISEYDIAQENVGWKNDLKGLHNLLFETLSKQTAGE